MFRNDVISTKLLFHKRVDLIDDVNKNAQRVQSISREFGLFCTTFSELFIQRHNGKSAHENSKNTRLFLRQSPIIDFVFP